MTILHRKVFYMIRHGQTHDNASGVISGGGGLVKDGSGAWALGAING